MLTFELGLTFVALSAAISVVITTLRGFLSFESPKAQVAVARLLPVLPLLLGLAAGWFAFTPDVEGVALGLLAGAMSGHSYKVFRQAIVGKI